MFASLFALGLIAWCACWEAWKAHTVADEAKRRANAAHCRLDRMQKHAKLTNRETVAVSYKEGFHPTDSWEDDFHRTQLRHKLKPSLYERFIEWLRY